MRTTRYFQDEDANFEDFEYEEAIPDGEELYT